MNDARSFGDAGAMPAMRAIARALACAVVLAAAPLHAQCFIDAQGADDEPGQKDLSQVCLSGTCGGTNVAATWSFDDTKWNGGNTGDGCALFDTDADGNANRAVCVSIGGTSVIQPGQPKCYTCADSAPDRCPSSMLVACTSTCSVAIAANDPFALDPNHVGNACDDTAGCPGSATCCRNKDAQTSCCLTSTDAGTGGALLDVCSYPSAQPNSAPSDCITTTECAKQNPNDPVCNDQNPCTVDSCDSTLGVCRHVPGNGGAVCRSANGQCDVQETCTGSSATCPPDGFASGTLCRNATGLCDVAESCDGTSAACPADGVAASGVVCRAANGNVCDVAEVCDGVNKACPADGSQPNSTPCNDDDACTTGDHCDGAGGCVGGTSVTCNDDNPCTDDGCNQQTGCTHVNNAAPCDDDDACTTPDSCSGGACVGGPAPSCNDDNACTDDGCGPQTGCTHDANASPCTDNNACTTGDTCSGGACVGGPAPNCDDGDVCTDDSCDPVNGCEHEPNTAPCNDNDACTAPDVCSGGSCGSAPITCTDNNGCTDDGCDPGTGCTYTPNNAPCDDGDACTTGDACSGASCAGGPPTDCNDADVCTDDGCDPQTGCTHDDNTAPCNDNDACTVGDTCSAGVCTGGPAANCDDDDACTTDSCDNGTGCIHAAVPDCCNTNAQCADSDFCTTNERCENHACVSDPVVCNDDNPCTDDGCDPSTGCTATPNNAPCDDDDACTTGDACAGGSCVGGPPPNCNDDEVCTDDGCDPATGCTHTANDDPCDDGDACTVGDACAAGSCVGGAPPNCDDGDGCTDDLCDPGTGCFHENNAASCDDNDACTASDVCNAGICGGAPILCNDNDVCTDDDCDPQSGCIAVPNSAPCDDSSLCTVGDVCAGGSCQSGTPVNCNDNNVCTNESCDPSTGVCGYTPSGLPCNDNDACTTNDTCVGPICQGGPPPTCTDDDPCTSHGCDPALGCTLLDNTEPCDDGDPCTANDTCASQQCQPGTPIDCNDNDGCTDDTCNPQTGACEYVDNSAPCDDGDVCTLNDTCFQGACQPGPPDACGDGNACTTDTCDPIQGCQHAPVPQPCCNLDAECQDTDECTVDERCIDHECVSDPRDCDDDDQCTIDTCDNSGGGFMCEHTPCFQIQQGQACPSPACIPAVCGDGIIGNGETCDPPGSSTSKPFTVCGQDCTYCGDGVVQPSDETCDDGNILEGCIKNDSFPVDGCRNDCTLHICRDPTKAVLAASIDKFTFHGRLTSTAEVDFGSGHFAVQLATPSGEVLFRRSLPAGAIGLASTRNPGRFRYTNRAARQAGGISKVKVRRNGDAYRATVEGYGNLLGVQEHMVTQVRTGTTRWLIKGDWEQRGPRLWRFIEP